MAASSRETASKQRMIEKSEEQTLRASHSLCRRQRKKETGRIGRESVSRPSFCDLRPPVLSHSRQHGPRRLRWRWRRRWRRPGAKSRRRRRKRRRNNAIVAKGSRARRSGLVRSYDSKGGEDTEEMNSIFGWIERRNPSGWREATSSDWKGGALTPSIRRFRRRRRRRQRKKKISPLDTPPSQKQKNSRGRPRSSRTASPPRTAPARAAANGQSQQVSSNRGQGPRATGGSSSPTSCCGSPYPTLARSSRPRPSRPPTRGATTSTRT